MMRWFLMVLLSLVASSCLLPADDHSPGRGVRVVYRPGDSFRLSDAKLRELDARLDAVLECLPDEVECTREIPEVYVTRGCLWLATRYPARVGGEYDSKVHRIYVPRSLGALAHEAAHHYTCQTTHGGKSWSNVCGTRIDTAFREANAPECAVED